MMKKNEIFKNKEGYTDKVAGAAITAADRPPRRRWYSFGKL